MPRGSAPGERRGGRAAGTPNKATRSVRTLAEPYAPAAIRTLAEIMESPKSPPQARVAAANGLLDRWAGKPPQALTGPDGEALRLVPENVLYSLTVQQVALVESLMKMGPSHRTAELHDGT